MRKSEKSLKNVTLYLQPVHLLSTLSFALLERKAASVA